MRSAREPGLQFLLPWYVAEMVETSVPSPPKASSHAAMTGRQDSNSSRRSENPRGSLTKNVSLLNLNWKETVLLLSHPWAWFDAWNPAEEKHAARWWPNSTESSYLQNSLLTRMVGHDWRRNNLHHHNFDKNWKIQRDWPLCSGKTYKSQSARKRTKVHEKGCQNPRTNFLERQLKPGWNHGICFKINKESKAFPTPSHLWSFKIIQIHQPRPPKTCILFGGKVRARKRTKAHEIDIAEKHEIARIPGKVAPVLYFPYSISKSSKSSKQTQIRPEKSIEEY